MTSDRTNRILLRLAGALSLLAAGLHGAAAPAHFEEWWGYGLFFVLAAAAQALLGLALLALAVGREPPSPRVRAYRRHVALVGVAGTVAVVALYVVTRTTGIPLLGPQAGAVEPWDGWDSVATASKATEGVLLLLLIMVLRRERKPSARDVPTA